MYLWFLRWRMSVLARTLGRATARHYVRKTGSYQFPEYYLLEQAEALGLLTQGITEQGNDLLYHAFIHAALDHIHHLATQAGYDLDGYSQRVAHGNHVAVVPVRYIRHQAYACINGQRHKVYPVDNGHIPWTTGLDACKEA